MSFWPFKKKPKLIFVETKAEVKRIENKAEKEKLNEQRVAANKKFLKEIVTNFIHRNIEDFRQRHPQPYQPGDKVVTDYYSHFPKNRGWLSSARSIGSTFPTVTGVQGPAIYTISKVWISTSWFEEYFNPSWGRKADEIVEQANGTEVHVSNLFRDAIDELLKSGELFEWCVDFDWDAHKFQYDNPAKPDKKYLDLTQWQGIYADTVLPIESPIAQAQIDLYTREVTLKEAKESYDKKYKQLEDDRKALKV